MENLVPLGTGNSRLMKSNIPASTTLAQLIQMLNNGTFPYDIGPLNSAGISQQGTPLNKDTLFSDDTKALYPEGVNNPNDAFEYLRKYGAGATATYPAALEITAGDVCDVVDGQANSSIVVEPGEVNLITNSRSYASGLIKLNDNYSVVAYTTSNKLEGYLIDNRTGKRVGSALNLYGYAVSEPSIAKLDDSRFVFAFKDSGSGTGYGHANAGQLFGTMVTVGTGIGTRFESSTIYDTYIVPFSNTHFVVLYRTATQLNVKVGYSTSGLNVSFSSNRATLSNIVPTNIRGILLPDDSSGNYRILVVFADNKNSNILTAVVVNVSKSSPTSMPTFGEKLVLSTSGVGTSSISLCLSGDKVIISYQSNNEVRLMKVSVSGTTITKEGSDVGAGFGSGYTSLANNNGTIVLAASGKLSFVDSNTLSVSGTYEFSSNADRNLCEFMDSSNILVCYIASGSVNMYSQIAKIQNGLLGGKFTINSTQAIALNSANVGEDVTLLFGGSAPLPGATAGTEIISDGILGEVPVAGMVTALSKGIRNSLTQIYTRSYTGSYAGTGTYGADNPNTLTFPFTPKIWGIYAMNGTALNMSVNPLIPWGVNDYIRWTPLGYTNLNTVEIRATFSGNTVSWYSPANAANQDNSKGGTYSYFAIG